ncbi:MAG: transglycosylase domain-containing protein [Gammaproteobacteria bacterium]|nr:transglycosylase domain-containing protein [Gammaproteobacteria bacterium]
MDGYNRKEPQPPRNRAVGLGTAAPASGGLRRSKPPRPAVRRLGWLRKTVYTLFVLSIMGLAGVGGVSVWIWQELPAVDILQDIHLQQPLRIYSSDGVLIGEFGAKVRQPVVLDNVPRHVINAFLASEDSRFLEHSGVDFIGLARAVFVAATTLRISQGASTITMQVARNYFLNREKTFVRKWYEVLLALKIERELSKQQILELYLNRIFFGFRAYGIEAAAQVYYGKSSSELTIAEAAMLAGVPQRPSANNPVRDPTSALNRRNHYVLPRMHALGMISAEQLSEGLATPDSARVHSRQVPASASHFVEMVRLSLQKRYDELFFESGYNVYTTLDSRYQAFAAQALQRGVQDYEMRQGYTGPVGRLEYSGADGTDDRLEKQIEAGNTDDRLEERGGADGTDDRLEEHIEAGARASLVQALNDFSADRALPADLNFAVVVDVNDSMRLLTTDGQEHVIDADELKQVYKSAKKNSEKTDDLLSPGDVVIVQIADGAPVRLAQMPTAQAALYSLDPRTGAIRAMVGGYGLPGDHFNRATQARRQVGSLFKPFLYSAALASGYNPSTVINDTNVSFTDASLEEEWRPSNYSNRVFGPTLLRDALVYSRNLVSIKLLEGLGIGATRRWMLRFGFDSERQVPKNLTMALGSGVFSPEQISTGLSVLANGGYKIQPWFIEYIEDAQGQVVFRQDYTVACLECLRPSLNSANFELAGLEAPAGDSTSTVAGAITVDATGELATDPATHDSSHTEDDGVTDSDAQASRVKLLNSTEETYILLEDIGAGEELVHRISEAEQTLDPRIALLVGSMMNDVIKRGTAARAYRHLKRIDLYGKTGTTNRNRDAWFAGYHPQLLTTVWVGRDDNDSLGKREAGGKTALPVWIEYMRPILAGLVVEQTPMTDGVQLRRVSRKTGEITSASTTDSYFEYFLQENLPPPEEAGQSDQSEAQSDALNEIF